MAAMAETAACDAFIGKWHAREPGMAIAEGFCPGALRLRFRLWGALLSEMREAAFELSDARVVEVKSSWWADELVRTGKGQPRHPLTQALADEIGSDGPWSELARGVAMAASSEARPADAEAAVQSMRSFATAIVRFENALFASSTLENSGQGGSIVADRDSHGVSTAQASAVEADAVQATCVHLLVQRLQTGLRSDDGGRVPLSLLARHRINAAQLVEVQGAPALLEWASTLQALSLASTRFDTTYRAVRTEFDRGELRHLTRIHADLGPSQFSRLAPLHDVWIAWRAARRVRSA